MFVCTSASWQQRRSHGCLCCSPDEFKFGCTSLRVPQELLHHLRNDITVSPNGVAFVKVQPHVNEV